MGSFNKAAPFDETRYTTILGPDSCDYQLNNGQCWPDIDSFIQYDWDQLEAEEAARLAK